MTRKIIDKEVPVRIRPATEIDVSFIFNSWLKSFRPESFARNISSTVFFSEHHKLIENLLKSCDVFIACDHTNPSDIFGYICAERVNGILVVHYVYVKQIYRRLGIARQLMEHVEADFSIATIFTHHTKLVDRLTNKYNLVYSPYVAFLPEYRKVIEAVEVVRTEETEGEQNENE